MARQEFHARQLFSNLHCGQRLVNRVSRPAEQSDLLPADDGHRAFFQTLQIGLCLRARAKRDILFPQKLPHFGSSLARIIQLSAPCASPPASLADARKTPSHVQNDQGIPEKASADAGAGGTRGRDNP